MANKQFCQEKIKWTRKTKFLLTVLEPRASLLSADPSVMLSTLWSGSRVVGVGKSVSGSSPNSERGVKLS